MTSIFIQNGQTETIVVYATKNSLKATGLTDVILNIRRLSDNYFYDFNDSTFKNSGWVEQNHIMVEVGTLGQYEYDFNTIGLSDDIYICTATCTNINHADNIPQIGELRVGYWVDNVDATISSRATQAQILSDATPFPGANIALISLLNKYKANRLLIANNQLTIYDDNGTTPILVQNLLDKFGNPAMDVVYERVPI